MNLADAIRRAANRQDALPPKDKSPTTEGPKAGSAKTSKSREANEVKPKKNVEPNPEAQSPFDAGSRPPEPPSSAILGGNAVRLELFLSGEQMGAMLKSIMTGQHSVMTLREAASYLRVSPNTLQSLVSDGEIPAVEIDGRYRFPKTSLDDWMAVQTAVEEEKDVA